MSIELKIKAKHLALEPAIIRKEEQKLLKQAEYFRKNQDKSNEDKAYYAYLNLYLHRKGIVRTEARATNLARAFLKGIPYNQVEKKTTVDNKPYTVVNRIIKMVAKYGPSSNEVEVSKKVQDWLKG
jgi:hypothetical protein